jgi:predicted RNA binding protein YcfA (HicA-like mRNA interferase family)
MGSGYYATLIERLKAHGCSFKRQGKGSHEIWHSPVSGKSFPIATTIQSKLTANAILRQAGINEKI